MKKQYIRSWDCAIINNDQLKDPMYASSNKDIHTLMFLLTIRIFFKILFNTYKSFYVFFTIVSLDSTY